MVTGSSTRSCTIVLHDDRVSQLDVLGGTDVLSVGNLAYLSSNDASEILIIAQGRAAGQREVSLHIRLGTRFGYGNRTPGKLTLIEDEEEATATHIDISFRDRHLTRTDMWLMMKQLDQRIVYKDSQIYYLGHVVATTRNIHIHGEEVTSALVQQGKTKAIVRSESARFTILIQLSIEMFGYCHTGDLMFEKLIQGYLRELFDRWEAVRARHLVSIVLFGRRATASEQEASDFFHVIQLDTPSSKWNQVLIALKRAFNAPDIPQDVTLATKGSLLEAIHISALDFLEAGESLHLTSTGTSIIAITAGAGTFEASYSLLKKTTNILLGHSIGVDIVSIARKPDHPVPLFKYEIDGRCEFALPHWADISYWAGENDGVDILETNVSTDVCIKPLESLDMDEQIRYDDEIFRRVDLYDSKLGNRIALSASLESTRTIVPGSPQQSRTSPPVLKQRPSSSSIANTIITKHKPVSMLSNRKISLGPKGLAPMKSSAITTISETHVNQNISAKFLPNESKSGLANQIRASLKRRPSQASLLSRLTDDELITQPIAIQTESESHIDEDVLTKFTRSNSKTPKAFDGLASSPHKQSVDPGAEYRTPWLTLLNPCNIKKDNMRVASQYRQWQHVFPKAIESANFKWTSMCSPASLPLYNDLLPTTEELKKYYARSTRRIVCSQEGKRPHELMKHLVMLRLAHGFQLVTMPSSIEQTHVLMSIGADYHELQCLSDLELEIVEYKHNTTDYTNVSYSAEGYTRAFEVKAMLDDTSIISTTKFAEEELLLDWNAIDKSIESQLSSDSLFRMRFVLLPVELQSSDSTLADDEKRIDGIQRLTQQWQRHRVFTAEDHSHHISVVKKKLGAEDELNHNPLAIEYHTRDVSALINSQDVAVADKGEDSATPLFPESERYHSSNFDLNKLVRHMQDAPPHGVELRDRRWFTRIHLRCFRGDEMTNWLLQAFRDLSTRDDAVEIGNTLMSRGVFTHVRHKHDFRDGHYLYQITSSHRTVDYPNAIASVFNRGLNRAIPTTPSTEARMSPQVRPYRGDSESSGTESTSSVPVERKQVLLSQMLQYNVDPLRKSEHDEIINLHYDRIHNPENCYHIYIDWTLTTPMLIREAIQKWSALVEPYGLRLMQVPWLEAYNHSQRHPFKQARHFTLALEPPDRAPMTPQFGSLSNASRAFEDNQFYHKAVLRKLKFALDIEATDTISSKYEVLMTWGPMDFNRTQFVHRSGLLLAQISNDRKSDFMLLPNPLASGKAHAYRSQLDTLEGILEEVEVLTQDAAALKVLYDESTKPRIVAPSPFIRAAIAGSDFDVPPMNLPPLALQSRKLKTNVATTENGSLH